MTDLERQAQELARQVVLLAVLEEDKKSTMADFNARKKAIQLEINRISSEIRNPQLPFFEKEKVNKRTGEVHE